MRPFRNWVQDKWYEHLEECESYGIPVAAESPSVYFTMYKWWLKREYLSEKKVALKANR